jgi:periplasmic divalent cation tolerance protein
MHIIVLVTVKNKKEAQRIATKLVSEKLIACANIIDNIDSIFWWKGKVDSSREVLLILKSQKKLFKRIEKLVKTIHSYCLPEIIALPIVAGEKKYLEWINTSVR